MWLLFLLNEGNHESPELKEQALNEFTFQVLLFIFKGVCVVPHRSVTGRSFYSDTN